jgi:hypothetical protein
MIAALRNWAATEHAAIVRGRPGPRYYSNTQV